MSKLYPSIDPEGLVEYCTERIVRCLGPRFGNCIE